MSSLTPNADPILWMIIETPIPALSEGEKAGEVFKGGILGNDEQSPENDKTSKLPLPVGKLQKNLNDFIGLVGNLFIQAEKQADISQFEEGEKTKLGIKLDQIELSVAVNSEGEVGFWGLAKGKVGGATEIKLTFKRKES
ncbi:MAG: hypothetical protein GPJ07_08220 [Microcystis aeruginosa G13-07]|nr:hypothetical protein [Microcystis aeruginosa G13-07]